MWQIITLLAMNAQIIIVVIVVVVVVVVVVLIIIIIIILTSSFKPFSRVMIPHEKYFFIGGGVFFLALTVSPAVAEYKSH